MEIHKLLIRQLNRAEFNINELPSDLEKWQEFLSRVNKTYQENDQDRYLLDRSMDISSREMMLLNEKLEHAQHLARLCYWQYDGNTDYIFGSNELYNILNLNPLKPVFSYKEFLQFIHQDDRKKLQNLMKKCLVNKINYECEIRLNNQQGNYGWYRIIAHYQKQGDLLTGVIIDINKDKETEAKIKELNQKLLVTARRAGMSEVATSILHNIGNILNSSNVSLNLLKESLTQPYYDKLFQIVNMIKENIDKISVYLSQDRKGKLIPEYLIALTDVISNNHQKNMEEIESIYRDLLHIKDIVSIQQSISGESSIPEKIFIPELIETALQMSSNPSQDKLIKMSKKNIESINIIADKSKLLQILVNLIQNAKDAVLYSKNKKNKTIKFIVDDKKSQKIDIEVIDNGIGISPEHLSHIFSFGFTTKVNGHGFGLHSSALSAQDMGGSLKAESKGPGEGARFILTLPIHKQLINKGIFNE